MIDLVGLSSQAMVQLFAILLIICGVSSPNAGTVGQEATLARHDVVHGILRVTRHPFLWGVTLLAAGHVAMAPDAALGIPSGTLCL